MCLQLKAMEKAIKVLDDYAALGTGTNEALVKKATKSAKVLKEKRDVLRQGVREQVLEILVRNVY